MNAGILPAPGKLEFSARALEMAESTTLNGVSE